MNSIRAAARSPESRNFSWLMSEYVIRFPVTLVATAVVARYLGPEDFASFGLLHAFVIGVLPLTNAGLSNLVSREVINADRPTNVVLGTAAMIRFYASLLGVPVLWAMAAFSGSGYPGLVLFSVIAGVLNAATPLAVIDYYFQSQLQAKYAVTSRLIALLGVSFTQIGLAIAGAPPVAFLATLALQQPLTAVMYAIVYRSTARHKIGRWRVDKAYMRELASSSVKVVATNVTETLASRIPLLVLAQFGGPAATGVLTAVMRPVSMLNAFPNAVGSTLLPRMARARRGKGRFGYTEVIAFGGVGLALVGAAVSATLALGAPIFVSVMFGDEYSNGVMAFRIVGLMLFFKFVRAAMSKWIVLEGEFNWGLRTHLFALATAGIMSPAIIASPTAGMTASSLVIQAASASVLALLITSAGRRYVSDVRDGCRKLLARRRS